MTSYCVIDICFDHMVLKEAEGRKEKIFLEQDFYNHYELLFEGSVEAGLTNKYGQKRLHL